jgi:hypothetical protein
MIPIAIIAGMMVQYGGYGSPPPSSSYQSSGSAGVDTAPFVQLQRKCFDKAVGETQGATQDVKQQRFDTCFGLHEAMLKHVTAKLTEKEAAGVKHDIDRALEGVEKSYAKKLGVAMPEGTK